MEPRPNSWQIVVAGYWNRMIFSPEWVGQHLLQQELVDVLVPFVPDAPIIYRKNDIEIQIAATRLAVAARQTTEASLQSAEQMVCSILQHLPNTPISAVGVNLGFKDREPRNSLLGMFNLADDPDITTEGWRIEERQFVRRLTRDNQTLNLALSFKLAEVELDANFHSDTTSAHVARGLLNGHTAGMLGNLNALIHHVYGGEPANQLVAGGNDNG